MYRLLITILLLLGVFVGAATAWNVSSSAPLDDMRAAVSRLNTYSVVMESHEALGHKTEDVTIRFSYKAPGWARTDVLEGNHKGAVAIYNPETKKMRAKTPGLPTVGLSPDAKMARSLRGARMYEAGFAYMLRRADRWLEGGELVSEGTTTVGGRSCDVIRIVAPPPVEPGATAAERWAVDRQTHLPVERTQLDTSGRVVARTKYRDLVLNPSFGADHFDP